MAKALKGITRIEYEGEPTRGWMVRICRDGVRQQKFYGDKAFGGKNKALALAKECYADWLAKAPPIKSTRDLLTTRNTSGVVGVHLVRNLDSRWENAESFGYCASWITDDGVRQKISFAWKRYGKKKAFELACFAREKQIHERDKVLALFEKAGGKVTKAKPSAKVSAASKKAAKPVTKAKAVSKAKPSKAKPTKKKAAR
jgi:hypothetical protein